MNDIYSSILDCNKYAIEALRDKNHSTALELLRKAKTLLKSVDRSEKTMQLKAITYNNLGCFYKQQKNLRKSLIYLMQALSYELNLPRELTTIEGTYLNVSKIYSEMNDHEKSLNFALKAIKCIEDNFKDKVSVVSSLAIAYQQAGNEYFSMGIKNQGKIFVAQGYELALKYFGVGAEITKELERNLKKFKFEEKNNPVIDRMLNYFEKHLGSQRPSNGDLKSKDSRKGIQSHRKVLSLQPITDYKHQKPTQRMSYSKSPVKVEKNTKNLSKLSKIKPEIRAADKIKNFERNLSMFNKYNKKQNTDQAKKKIFFDQLFLTLQKTAKGWLARKWLKRRILLTKLVQTKAREYLKRLDFHESKPFTDQFPLKNLSELKKGRLKVNPNPFPTVKRKSFVEKILFLQRHIRMFLQRCKDTHLNIH